MEHTSADVFAMRGPFDDLFKGDPYGDLVQERRPRQPAGGRGGGRGGRKQQQGRRQRQQSSEGDDQ